MLFPEEGSNTKKLETFGNIKQKFFYRTSLSLKVKQISSKQ
jgi:hypothetical protein